MTSQETRDLAINVLSNSNIAWKNVSVIRMGGLVGNNPDDELVGANVLTGDPWCEGGTYYLEFKTLDYHTGNPN